MEESLLHLKKHDKINECVRGRVKGGERQEKRLKIIQDEVMAVQVDDGVSLRGSQEQSIHATGYLNAKALLDTFR